MGLVKVAFLWELLISGLDVLISDPTLTITLTLTLTLTLILPLTLALTLTLTPHPSPLTPHPSPLTPNPEPEPRCSSRISTWSGSTTAGSDG